MKYTALPKDLFTLNRSHFTAALKPGAMAIFNANDEAPRNGDQTFLFRQNSDLYYLSGIDQEQTILLLFPDCPNPLYREALFLRQTSDHIKVWEGYKYTKEQAREASGIQNIFWLDEFDQALASVIHYTNDVYLNTNENDRAAQTVPYRDLRFIHQLQQNYPLHSYHRAAPILRDLRAVKSRIEVDAIKKACDITNNAFRRVLKFVQPGVMEYEIEAEIIHEFIRSGSTGHAYLPIIASGPNANILHYNDNNQQCKSGDVILFDFGAEYANYNADMSRSIPVNGKFTPRQADVYNAVLRVMQASIKMLKPGTMWNAYHEEVGEVMTEELIKLGLLTPAQVAAQDKNAPAYKKYFMHGNSHHLGLDVHDFAGRYTPFATGNVLTVEPGIYIPEEGLGIRLENNILITESGQEDLMADIPLALADIEHLMQEGR